MIKCFLNFEHDGVGVFPVLIKSSVRIFFSVFQVLDMEIKNIMVRPYGFNSFEFLKINIIN